jgi:hypothetical protein
LAIRLRAIDQTGETSTDRPRAKRLLPTMLSNDCVATSQIWASIWTCQSEHRVENRPIRPITLSDIDRQNLISAPDRAAARTPAFIFS